MTRDETKVLLLRMMSLYPNYKPADLGMAIDSWHKILCQKDAQVIDDALTVYTSTDTSGFAPSVGQLNALIAEASISGIQEGEIRNILVRASRNANYGAQEEFDRMPEELQKAVGSASVVRSWGMKEPSDLDYEFSRIIKTYQQGIDEKRRNFSVPVGISLNVYERIGQKNMPFLDRIDEEDLEDSEDGDECDY